MKSVLAVLIVFSSLLSAQTDRVKWEPQTISYLVDSDQHHDYTVDNSSFGMKVLSGVKNTYYFLISDLDGDNCPFYPTCSSFFVQAVKETNLLKGTLMFADRFTRDINFFKGRNHYPFYKNGRLYDPVSNYSLNPAKIKFFPGGEFINSGNN